MSAVSVQTLIEDNNEATALHSESEVKKRSKAPESVRGDQKRDFSDVSV